MPVFNGIKDDDKSHNKLEIVEYQFSKIPKSFHNSRFVETTNLHTVIDQLKEDFKPGEKYTQKEIISKIKVYF